MPELGTKHECFHCGAKFYDLGKPEPICPKCGANQKDAKRQESTTEPAPAKRRRRDDVVKVTEVDESDELVSADGDDFGDEDLVAPEGVDDEEDEPEDDDDD